MIRFANAIITPTIQNSGELAAYVARATAVAVAVALAIDVANQLIFFISWQDAVRSWIVTILAAVVIAVPILYGIGRTHLALHQAKADVEHLSLTDPLTGLPNRRLIVARAEQASNASLVLVIADIDRFKAINDTHGHRIGDAVLKLVGRMMESELRHIGTVGRFGGEEFAVISQDVPPLQVADAVKDFCSRIASIPIITHGIAIRVTISAGAATGSAGSFDDLYAEADRALYLAKSSGRNRLCLSSELPAQSVVS